MKTAQPILSRWLPVLALAAAASFLIPSTEAATCAQYRALTTRDHTAAPFDSVAIAFGPPNPAPHPALQWWQLQIRTNSNPSTIPLLTVRLLTSANPLLVPPPRLEIARYILRLPATAETLEYRDCHTGGALLPPWKDFVQNFLPHATDSAALTNGFPETCEFLGHVLTLMQVGNEEPWNEWPDVRTLNLDREVLVGTSRNFRDQEGHRLPQKPERQDYTYVPFEQADYPVMIDAGINLFIVNPNQESWVRSEPVFYLRRPEGEPPLNYPADLYRGNYLGPVMFMDEPSILMVGDPLIHDSLRYFSDAAALIEKRTRNTYLGDGSYGAFSLEKSLRERGVNLGDLRLMQWDIPSWETLYYTTYYQMKGGGSGLVHEGRYQLAAFDEATARFTGVPRRHTAREMLQYHYAFLRGGTRAFGKHWGTAIYGQCDTNLAPEALTLAYNMGARYFWFWTSDHDHHVPWTEQLTLARTLRNHVASHPRLSIFSKPAKLDTVIVLPNGHFLSLDDLWWVRVMDKDGRNEASQGYRRLMRRVLEAVQRCWDRDESFDIAVDDGHPLRGYRRIVRITDD